MSSQSSTETTVQDRYDAATAYVRRAIDTVEKAPIEGNDALVGGIDAYAAKLKTQPAKDDLRHIVDRWAAAATYADRQRIARDAELLADRVEENLPGAPRDRVETNLFKGEAPSSAPATSMQAEMDHQAADVAHWVKKQSDALEKHLSNWFWFAVLIAGGVAAYKLTAPHPRGDQ